MNDNNKNDKSNNDDNDRDVSNDDNNFNDNEDNDRQTNSNNNKNTTTNDNRNKQDAESAYLRQRNFWVIDAIKIFALAESRQIASFLCAKLTPPQTIPAQPPHQRTNYNKQNNK